MAKVSTYLNIANNTEKALNFYSSVFANSSTEMMVKHPEDYPDSGKVMYSEFQLNRYNNIAMDGPGVHEYTINEAVSFTVSCQTREEINYYWNKLSKGGSEWQCGWLKDKFGVSWQIVPDILASLMSEPARSDRVVNAFMQMKKFDIEKLVNA